MIEPGEISIKNTQVFKALMERNYAPLLIIIISEVAEKFGVYITEAWRKPLHSGDVHAYGRGIDLRVRVYESLEKAEQIRDWINKKWEYDFKRPRLQVAIIHNSGNGIHFHIQCSTNTRLRQL